MTHYAWHRDTCGRWEAFTRDFGLSWIDVDVDGTATVFLDGYFDTATLRRVSDDADALVAADRAVAVAKNAKEGQS